MNKHQKKENREIKKLMWNWWATENDEYKVVRRNLRKIKRNLREGI